MTQSGNLATANVYRFSSKEIHAKSGMSCSGFRFYDPHLQRWPNRDPIGESGGVSLYRFAKNIPNNGADSFGLNDGDVPLPPGFHHYSPGSQDAGYGEWTEEEDLSGCLVAAKARRAIRDYHTYVQEIPRACIPHIPYLTDTAHAVGVGEVGDRLLESERLENWDCWACYDRWNPLRIPPKYQLPKLIDEMMTLRLLY